MQRGKMIEEIRLKILKKAKRQYPYFIWNIETDDLFNYSPKSTYYINNDLIVYIIEVTCNNLRMRFYLDIREPRWSDPPDAVDMNIAKKLKKIVADMKRRLRKMYK